MLFLEGGGKKSVSIQQLRIDSQSAPGKEFELHLSNVKDARFILKLSRVLNMRKIMIVHGRVFMFG